MGIFILLLAVILLWAIFNKNGTNYTPPDERVQKQEDIYIGYGIRPEEYRAMMEKDHVAQAEQQQTAARSAYTTTPLGQQPMSKTYANTGYTYQPQENAMRYNVAEQQFQPLTATERKRQIAELQRLHKAGMLSDQDYMERRRQLDVE